MTTAVMPQGLTYTEKSDALRMYHEEGVTVTAIARELSRHPNTIRRFLDPAFREQDDARLRAYKDSRSGVCVDCGGVTRYRAHAGETTASDRCFACSINRTKAGAWTKEEIIEAIQVWASEHDGNPPSASDWNGRIGDPRFPTTNTVYNKKNFPTWSEAIEAAGFPRPRSGIKRGHKVRRLTVEDKERAKELHAEGMGWYDIGQEMGIATSSARRLVSGQYQPREVHHRRIWTRERVINAIQTWAAEHDGRPPTSTQWVRKSQDGRFPAAGSCFGTSGMFNSWADAIEGAGFPRPTRGGDTTIRRNVPVDLESETNPRSNKERKRMSLIKMARKLSNAGMTPEKISGILGVDTDLIVGWVE